MRGGNSGCLRFEGGAFSGVRLETGKGKRIRRLEDQSATLTADKKVRRFGPSAFGGLRFEAGKDGR